MKRFSLFILGTVLCLMMSSCALLPQEETFAKAPIGDVADALPYTFTTVERGDLALEQSVYCVYGSVRKESLSFPMDGSRIDAVFVTTGDTVEQGQLLATIDLTAAYDRLDVIAQELSKLALQQSYIDRYEALALDRAALENKADAALRKEATEQVTKQYDKQRLTLNDQQSCLELEKQELNERISQGELRAPFDGTVTYARASIENTLTNKDYTIFTVVDSARSVFSAQTEYWPLFHPGDAVDIVMLGGETVYPATVVSETELGKPETEKVDGAKATVYFELDEPAYNLEYDDHANVILTIDSRHDVLLLNTRALVNMGDEKIVYYIDPADGLKKYKPVTLGLVASMRAEILSGLSEGEQVILK